MKNKYQNPTIEIVRLNPMDIIATSGEQGGWNADVQDGVGGTDENSIPGDYNDFLRP